MKAKEVLLSGVTGTTFMTLFSHMIGDLEQENFSEPNLLSELFNRLVPGQTKKTSRIVGWNAHFLVGLLFALAYVELWDAQKLKPTVKNGTLLGGISGIVAIAVWKTTFKTHPIPPGINFKKYYAQLWVAHVVFGIFSTLTYQLLKDREEKRKLENDQKYLSNVNP